MSIEKKVVTSVDIGTGLEIKDDKLQAKKTTVKEHTLTGETSIAHNGDVQMVFVNGKLLMSSEYEVTETEIEFNEQINGEVSVISGNIIFE